MSKTRTLGAILFNDFEILDLCGPLEMFGNVGKELRIVTIAEQAGPVKSVQGPSMLAEEDFNSAPPLDVILLPGGLGTETEQQNPAMLGFLRDRAAQAELVTTVCTGSALLAASGVLDGLAATSNKLFFELARSQSDQVEWRESARWVEDDKVFTSSGVSAGIDMSLAAIARLYGNEKAEQIAVFTEYSWHRDANDDPFNPFLNQGKIEELLETLGRA
ncbi:MAG: dimethyladenosine transferase [Salinisphaeraceae bacterium]|nr:dimethyladenosine transferase [Salinisphaeraceae bacterium]